MDYMCPSSGNHAVAAVLIIMHAVKQLVYFVVFYTFMNYMVSSVLTILMCANRLPF